MEHQMKYDSSVPASIQLLFNNEKLDLMKLLCLLNVLSADNNKQRKVEELLFYFSLVNFDLIYLFDKEREEKNGFAPSTNQFFRFQTKINGILIAMSHLKFIEIRGNMSNKLDELKVKLLSAGKEFYNEYQSEYFPTLFDKYIEVYKRIEYTPENVKKIKEGKN